MQCPDDVIAAAADAPFVSQLLSELGAVLQPSKLLFVSLSVDPCKSSDEECPDTAAPGLPLTVLAVFGRPVLQTLEVPLLEGFKKAIGTHVSAAPFPRCPPRGW